MHQCKRLSDESFDGAAGISREGEWCLGKALRDIHEALSEIDCTCSERAAALDDIRSKIADVITRITSAECRCGDLEESVVEAVARIEAIEYDLAHPGHSGEHGTGS